MRLAVRLSGITFVLAVMGLLAMAFPSSPWLLTAGWLGCAVAILAMVADL